MLNIIKSDIDDTYMLLDIVEHNGVVTTRIILETTDLGNILSKIEEDMVPSNSVGSGNIAGTGSDVVVPRRAFLKYLRRRTQR